MDVGYDEDNVFKKIIAGSIPCFKIFETAHCIAILDAFPVCAGHSLLIPKGDYATVADMPAEVSAAVWAELPRLIKAVTAATGASGCNILSNLGKTAGQEVFHAHVHVIPRSAEDKLKFRAPPPEKPGQMIDKDAADAMVDMVKSNL